MKALGIDYGTKRVGIALSDDEGRLAFPSRTLANDHRLVEEVCALVEREGVDTIVIGESRDFHGNENPIMRSARDFVDQLERHTGIEVMLEPEFLTSTHASHSTEKEHRDAAAAAIILQTFLDRGGASD